MACNHVGYHRQGRGGGAAQQGQRAAVLVTMVLGAALVLFIMAHTALSSGSRYVVVIDSGSSGTRLYVYSWQTGVPGSDLPALRALKPSTAASKVPRRLRKGLYNRVETQPGLDHFVDDAAGLQAKALGPLLAWARGAIPAAQQPRVPVFLLATAGLRRLPDADRERLLTNVRAVLSSSGLWFKPEWVKVISGFEEGLYGWIALNYAQGLLGGTGDDDSVVTPPSSSSSLSSYSPSVAAAASSTPHSAREADTIDATARHMAALLTGHHHTVGVLDLGGSSMEVAFAFSNVSQLQGNARPEDLTNITVAGATYQLFTRSFKHYGLSAAFDRSVSVLLADSGGGGNVAAPVVPHPCLAQGYRQEYKRLPLDAAGGPPQPPRVMLLGSADMRACAQLAGRVVNATAPCASPPCTLGLPHPPLAGKFIAITGYYVVWAFFKMRSHASLADLEHATDRLCTKPWSAIQTEQGDAVNLEMYCLWGHYVPALLQQGLRLSTQQVRFGSGDVGWPLGAALVEAAQVPDMLAAHTESLSHAIKAMHLGARLRHPSRALLFLLVASAALLVCALRFALVRSAADGGSNGRRRVVSMLPQFEPNGQSANSGTSRQSASFFTSKRGSNGFRAAAAGRF